MILLYPARAMGMLRCAVYDWWIQDHVRNWASSPISDQPSSPAMLQRLLLKFSGVEGYASWLQCLDHEQVLHRESIKGEVQFSAWFICSIGHEIRALVCRTSVTRCHSSTLSYLTTFLNMVEGSDMNDDIDVNCWSSEELEALMTSMTWIVPSSRFRNFGIMHCVASSYVTSCSASFPRSVQELTLQIMCSRCQPTYIQVWICGVVHLWIYNIGKVYVHSREIVESFIRVFALHRDQEYCFQYYEKRHWIELSVGN